MIVTTPHQPSPEWQPGARAVGETFRGRRIGAAMTLRLCAELMRISMADLSKIERGERPMYQSERDAFENAIRSRGVSP